MLIYGLLFLACEDERERKATTNTIDNDGDGILFEDDCDDESPSLGK